MSIVRVLNEEGVRRFEVFIAEVRRDDAADVPHALLFDGNFSEPIHSEIRIEKRGFSDAFEFGSYLNELLSPIPARELSRNHGLWSWLALFYFDVLVKRDAAGKRIVLESSVYILGESFVFRRYYRHIVRTPWEAVRLHGDAARVLLITRGKGTRSDISEQLGASQDIFASRRVILAAHSLYFDVAGNRPKSGTGGKGLGSPRRLKKVVNQLWLTYDLEACQVSQLTALLPAEFDRWKGA